MTPTPEIPGYKTYRAMRTFRTQGLRLALILCLAHLLIISHVARACIGNGESFIFSTPEASENKSPTRPKLKANPGKWYVFTSPDGDFKLEFPGKPSEEPAIEGPVTLIRMFGVNTADGIRFSINFQDIGGDPQAPENNEWRPDLEEITSAADRNRGLRVVQVHRLARNIVETEIQETIADTQTDIRYLRRSLIRRGRLYTFICGSFANDKPINKPLCQRFFNSMRFIGTRSLRHARKV
jgi:hypothetical protein